MNEFTKALLEQAKNGSMGKDVQMPPPAIKGLEPTFLEYVPGKSIKVSFPVKESYNNPFGITFGGYLGMFFDTAFGPFSGLTAGKPTTSLDMNIAFLKPLSPKDGEVIIDVEVVSLSKSYLILHAKAYSGRGVLVSTATTRMLILNR